jgi:hypothetical protein
VRDFESRFLACGKSRAFVRFLEAHSLVTQGYIFDTVEDINPDINEPVMEESTEDRSAGGQSGEIHHMISENLYGNEYGLFSAIWRCLTYDRYEFSEPSEAPAIFELYFGTLFDEEARLIMISSGPLVQWYLFNHIRNFKIYGRSVGNWSSVRVNGSTEIIAVMIERAVEFATRTSSPFKGPTPSFKSYLRALRATRYRRRMMVTSRGYVGIAHNQSQVGDSIVLLKGATIPMILRKCEGGWRLIGEAYVQDIMNGEFWNEQKEEDLQKFLIK